MAGVKSDVDPAAVAFLNHEVEDQKKKMPRPQFSHYMQVRFIVFWTIAIVLYTAAIVAVQRYLVLGERRCGYEAYSPAQEAVQFEDWNYDAANLSANPFVGDPRPELDHAWNTLIQNIHIRITPEEHDLLLVPRNRSTLQLSDGTGYLIGLGVYHELHCLKWIRHWIHRDVYWPDLTGAALEERKWHIEHCFELLRVNTMCSANLAPSTFYWRDTDPPQLGTHQHDVNQRKCVKWDVLDEWGSKRRVDVTDQHVLRPS